LSASLFLDPWLLSHIPPSLPPSPSFSVLWELTPKADIVAVDFCKSIIRSVASLSYQEAQNIHDDPRRNDAVALVGREGGREGGRKGWKRALSLIVLV